jgi:lipopolysaccharide heptosyltransferase II
MQKEFNNIVIMRTDRLGEVLLSTVAVEYVKKAFPLARVTFVTSGYSRPIVEMSPDLEEVVAVDTFNKKGWLKRAVELSKFFRKKSFDAAIILNPHKITHLAAFLAGIPCRLGYDRKWGFLLTHRVKDDRDSGEKHEVDHTLEFLSNVLGGGDIPCSPKMHYGIEAEREAKMLLNANGIDHKKPIVAIHPSAGNPCKEWGADKYRELVKKLSAKDLYVCLVGDKSSRKKAEGIVKGLDPVKIRDLTGFMGIKALGAFFSMAKLFIGNDTGPMHIAAAVGTPVIALFGRNIKGAGPKRWGPWGKGNKVFHKPACSPCLDAKCDRSRQCMENITVDEVYSSALKILKTM